MFFGHVQIIIICIMLVINFTVHWRLKRLFKRFEDVTIKINLTGAQLVSTLLSKINMRDITVEQVEGEMTDHYDPSKKIIRLSAATFHSKSITANAVAAYMVGFAVQHKNGYSWLALRSSLQPFGTLISTLTFPLIIIAIVFHSTTMLKIGTVGLILSFLIALLCMPVHIHCKRLAFKGLKRFGLIIGPELDWMNRLLNAASVTYILAPIMAFVQLFRLIFKRHE